MSTPSKKKTKKVTPLPKGKSLIRQTSIKKSASPRKRIPTEKGPSGKPVKKVVAEVIDDLDRPVSSTTTALAATDSFTQYLAEIRKYPLLTREQELELTKQYYETKDPLIAQALVTANLRFVVKVAAEYSRFGAKMIDLVQEGNLGLMHAVRDFNPYRGVRLITYAVWWIRGYIQEYLMKQYSLVKIGTTHNRKKLFYQLEKQKKELETLGINPDPKLIAARLGVTEDEVSEMSQRLAERDLSLDQAISPDSSEKRVSFQKSTTEPPDENLSKKEELMRLREKIENLRPSLNEREKILLEERLLSDDPLTLQEIGEKYKITREAVRQAESRLMEKIKELYLKDF